jgi:zinc protease
MEYRSSISFLGLPLVHVSTGAIVEGCYRRGIATAWLAVGDIAIGVVCACGGVALGGFCVGGVAVGLLPIGGFALGALAIAGVAVGFIAVGGAAIGWYAAVGGLAVANEYAVGGVALARTVLAPPTSKALPWSTIPHAPFEWADAFAFALICVVLVVIALAIQSRRKE